MDVDNQTLQKIDTRGIPNNLFEQKYSKKEGGSDTDYYNHDNNRFASISSDPNFKETMNYTGEEKDPGILGSFGGVVGSAFSRASELVYGAKDKCEEYEVGSKLKTTGEVTVNILKSTGSAIHNIATSDTTKHIIGKTGENIGYLFIDYSMAILLNNSLIMMTN